MLFVDKDGREVDWIVGYGPPADAFLEKVQKSLAGTDTYLALSERYAKEPENIEVLYKLAGKDERRYSPALIKQADELYRKIVALDPEGKSGTTTIEGLKATVSYTEAAEFNLGRMAVFSRKPDPAALRAFIAKYPQSPIIKSAYASVSIYYQYYAPKEDAAKFFEEYTAKYPQEATVLNSYVERIIKDKEPVDKGLELAEKVKEIRGYPRNPEYTQNLAQLHILKGDEAKAEEEYGPDFANDYVNASIRVLTSYANFWLEQNKNLDSVEAMADLAVKMAPASQWYTLQTAAGIYVKLNKMAKATDVYGPEFVEKNMADQDILASYASFWNRQGKNLESALGAAAKSVALSSDYYNNFTLANVLVKLKRFEEALAPAEKALELIKPIAAKSEGFSIQQYENLVKQIKDAIAKEKPAAEIK